MWVRPFSRFFEKGARTKIDHPVNLLICKDFTDKSFVLKDLANHHR